MCDGREELAFQTGEQVASRAKTLDGEGDGPGNVAQLGLVKVPRNDFESGGELGYPE